MNSFSEIVDLIKVIEGVDKDAKIIDILNTVRPNFYNWKRRNTIPIEVLVEYCEQREISLSWLLTGKGSMFLTEEEKDIKQMRIRNIELERTVDELTSELKKIDAVLYMVRKGRRPDPGLDVS